MDNIERQYAATKGLGKGRTLNLKATEIIRKIAQHTGNKNVLVGSMEIELKPLARGKRK